MADSAPSIPVLVATVSFGAAVLYGLFSRAGAPAAPPPSPETSSSPSTKKNKKQKQKQKQKGKAKSKSKAKAKSKSASSEQVTADEAQPPQPASPQEDAASTAKVKSPSKSSAKKKAKKKAKKQQQAAAAAALEKEKEQEKKAMAQAAAARADENLDVGNDDGWETVKAAKSSRKKTIRVEEGAEVAAGSSSKIEDAVVDIGDKASILIGEKGVTINNIQNLSGAKLNTNKAKQTCTISGNAQQVAIAKRMVEDLLNNQNTLAIPLASRLEDAILRSPAHSSKIQAETGVRMTLMSENGLSVCKLSGKADQLEAAKKIISQLLHESANTDTKHTIALDAHMGRQLIGRKGATVSSLEQMTGASIHVEIIESNATVTILGSSEQKTRGVEAVQRFVRERSFSVTVPIDSNAIGMVLGNLNSLRSTSSVRIDVSTDRTSIKLTGTTEEVSDAKAKILKWINTELGPPVVAPGEILETIELGSSVGKVIGKGGSNIDELERNAPGVHVKVKLSKCYVYGAPAGVLKVKAEIDSIVAKHNEIMARAAKEESSFTGASWALPSETINKPVESAKWGTAPASSTFPARTAIEPQVQAVNVSDWGGALTAEGW